MLFLVDQKKKKKENNQMWWEYNKGLVQIVLVVVFILGTITFAGVSDCRQHETDERLRQQCTDHGGTVTTVNNGTHMTGDLPAWICLNN